MMHASRVLLWACVVAIVPTTAAAQRIEKGEATRLYEDALDHMEQARRMRERDNGAEAEKLLEQARGKLLASLKKAPTYVKAATALGQVLLDQGRSEEAVGVLTAALKATPGSAPLKHVLGIHLFRLKRYNEGARLLEDVARGPKVGFDVHYLLMGHYYRTRKDERALRHARAYLKRRPKDAQVHGVVGNLHLRRGRVEKAVSAFRRVLALEPDNIPVRVNLGNVFYKLGDYQKAIDVYEKVLVRQPDLALVHFNLGSSYYAIDKWKLAAKQFRAFIALKPDHPSAHFFAGAALVKSGQKAPGTQLLARATVLGPADPRAPYMLAQVALESSELMTADSYARTALERKPRGEPYLLLAGLVARRRKDLVRAVQHLSLGARVAPKNARMRAELGFARIMAGRLDAGIDDLEAARTIDPNQRHVMAWLPVARTRRAVQELRGGGSDKAEADLRRALEIDPKFVDAAWNLALMKDLAGDMAGALKVVQQALTHSSLNADLHLLAAYLLTRQGQLETAQAAVQRAKGARDVGMRWLVQGAIHGHFGEFDAAISALRQARAAGTDPEPALSLVRLDRAAAMLKAGKIERGSAALRQLGPRLQPAHARARAGMMAAALLEQQKGMAEVPRLLAELSAGPVLEGWGLEALRKDANLVAGYVYYRLGNERAAREQLTRYVEQFPTEPRGRRLLAVVLQDMAERDHTARRFGKAEELARRAVQLAGSDPRLRHNLACVLYSRGAHESASKTFRTLQAQGTVPEAALNLALYLDDVAGRRAQSLKLYRSYLEKGGIAAEVARRRIERKERIFGK